MATAHRVVGVPGMIPRQFHRIWLQRDEKDVIPSQHEKFWQRLRELHPGWKFKTWSSLEEAREYVSPANRKIFDESELAGRSDVLRYEIVAREGGIYVDTDVEPLRSFEPLTTDDQGRPFMAWEDDKRLCPTVIGGPAGHPALVHLVDSLAAWASKYPSDASPVHRTGPEFTTQAWRGREDVRRLPPWTFYPVGWSERAELGRMPVPARAFAVHHWAKGWGRTEEKLARRIPGDARVHVVRGKTPTVSLLVPFTSEEPARVKAWEWVRERWFEILPLGSEIIIGEDGGKPFSKTTAVNDAYSRSKGEVLVVVDADCWMDRKNVASAIEHAAREGVLVVPWHHVHRLSKEDSEAVASGLPVTPDMYRREDYSPAPSTAGTLYVIARSSFERVGGMDPRFRGWGFEDTAFSQACATLLGQSKIMLGEAFTLWHDRSRKNNTRVWQGDPGGLNRALARAYRQAFKKTDEMISLCKQHALPGKEVSALPKRATQAQEEKRSLVTEFVLNTTLPGEHLAL